MTNRLVIQPAGARFWDRYGIALSDLSGNNILIRREQTGIINKGI